MVIKLCAYYFKLNGELQVDLLEKRAKDCRKKHKYDTKGRADLHTRTDAHLLEKINLLQVSGYTCVGLL